MMTVMRIVDSHTRSGGVYLTLSPDNIEDPKSATVIFDSDDIPNYDNICFNSGAKTFVKNRPIAIVNGIEMHIISLQFNRVFDISTQLQGTMGWVISSPSGKTKSGWKKMAGVSLKGMEIIMIVQWIDKNDSDNN